MTLRQLVAMLYVGLMTENDQVELKLTGRVSFVHTITVVQAAEIMKYVMTPSASPPAGRAGSANLGSNGDSKETGRAANPREVLDSSGAKTNSAKIVALAASVLGGGEIDTFTVDMIKPLFKQAREATPANFTRDLDSAIRSGWIAAGSGNEYYVTEKGMTALESRFGETRERRDRAVGSKARSIKQKKPVAVPDVFANLKDGLPHEIPQVPTFHKMKTKRDRVLWSIRLAAIAGIPGLTNSQIVWLTHHLGDGVPSNEIAGNYRALQKAGLVNKDLSGLTRVSKKGEEYLLSLDVSAE